MPKIDENDVIGKRVGRLVVTSYHGRFGKHGHRHYLCLCDCGKEKVIARTSILNNSSKSCGCLNDEKRKKHGGSYDNAYWSWKAMLRRCENPDHDSYKHYGGAGITVCDRWKKYENFLQDMGEREKGVSIDRINPDGNYTPENCRWATPEEQSNNRRYNRHVEYEGKDFTCSRLARKFGIAPSTLNRRIFIHKWPLEEALGLRERGLHGETRCPDGRFRSRKGLT